MFSTAPYSSLICGIAKKQLHRSPYLQSRFLPLLLFSSLDKSIKKERTKRF